MDVMCDSSAVAAQMCARQIDATDRGKMTTAMSTAKAHPEIWAMARDRANTPGCRSDAALCGQGMATNRLVGQSRGSQALQTAQATCMPWRR
jgi:hypothetical protein